MPAHVPNGASGDARSISVVVASSRARTILNGCLESLLPQCERLGAELIVARTCGLDDIDALATRYPGVTFVSCPRDASIPVARGMGLSAAHGSLVALTEDHCVASDSWLEEISRHAEAGVGVVGGGMSNARSERTTEWAAFISEYGLYASSRPATAMSASQLTAANVAYVRSQVGDVAAWSCAGEWENVVHDRLAERGVVMRFAPSAVVYQNLTYSIPAFLADRFEHGYNFARKRVVRRTLAVRIAYAVATPSLPLIFAWRLSKTAAPGRWPTFLRALPLTITFLGAWALGEACGYLVGPE